MMNECIRDTIVDQIIICREQLEQIYGDQSERKYLGICNTATDILKAQLEKIPTLKIRDMKEIHGELAHVWWIPSKYWGMEHTMLTGQIFYDGHLRAIYIDPTSCQFQDIFDEAPDWYIGFSVPDWFYPDRDNPLWSIMNRKKQNVVRFFRYNVWGFCSDVYGEFRKIFKQ